MTSAKGIALTVTSLIAASICSTAIAAAPSTPDWIVESNKQAAALLEENAKYNPESASAIGVDGHDAEVFDAKPHSVQRQEEDLATVAAGYERALSTVSDQRVKQDIEILLKSARDQRHTLELNDRLMLPYFDFPQALFNGFHALLDPRVPKSRQSAALTRPRDTLVLNAATNR